MNLVEWNIWTFHRIDRGKATRTKKTHSHAVMQTKIEHWNKIKLCLACFPLLLQYYKKISHSQFYLKCFSVRRKSDEQKNMVFLFLLLYRSSRLAIKWKWWKVISFSIHFSKYLIFRQHSHRKIQMKIRRKKRIATTMQNRRKRKSISNKRTYIYTSKFSVAL